MSIEERAATLNQEEIAALLVASRCYEETFSRQERRISELEEKNGLLEQQGAALAQRSFELEQQSFELEQRNAELAHQLEWFKRQLFGEKSERRLGPSDPRQLSLGEQLVDERPPTPQETVRQYQRRRGPKQPLEGSPDDSGLRFDKSVPVKEIILPNPELEGLSAEDYEEVTEKVTYRLAQRPGSYVVLKFVRKEVKIKDKQKLSCPTAPPAVIEKSFADVSFIAGLLIDKCCYHQPLYRQHQRLQNCGIVLSRATLTNLVHSAAELLRPIHYALLSSILQSLVLVMDETPVKASRAGPGKMKKGYYWPILGDKNEIAFPFAASRAQKAAREILGQYCGILVTDGYKVYERLAQVLGDVVHAQCWGHSRRKFVEAEKTEPGLVEQALCYIRALYLIEEQIKEQKLQDEKKLLYRIEHSKPIVDTFFPWLDSVFQQQVLLPSSPFSKAANYALKREKALRVFLDYPDVPIDTNELERDLRPIPMGRRNWLFCWTEIGAEYIGIIQSLIQSCRLQGINPYIYLVDVLQRIDTHPAFDVHLLTPRLWKENFAANPMRSALEDAPPAE